MNIGYIIPEVGDYSSLSIEFMKWHQVLTDLGHTVHVFTGKMTRYLNNVTVMQEIAVDNDKNNEIYYNVFDSLNKPDDVMGDIESSAEHIESILSRWCVEKDIELLIVENYLSVPINLAVSYALFKLFKQIRCVKLIRHHDAFYKNNLMQMVKDEFVKKLLLTCFPIQDEHVFHIVTNRLIKTYLKEKCGVDSIIVPYVIDGTNETGLSVPNYPIKIRDEFIINEGDKLLMNFSF